MKTIALFFCNKVFTANWIIIIVCFVHAKYVFTCQEVWDKPILQLQMNLFFISIIKQKIVCKKQVWVGRDKVVLIDRLCCI